MHSKKRDLLLILLWPILASMISFAVSANYFVSIILFFGVPAVYLSFLKPKFIKKIALFSLILGIPLSIIIDYIMEITRAWFTPTSIFGSFLLFGTVMIEDIIFMVLYLYLVAMFYEVFLEKPHKAKLADRNLKYLFIGGMVALTVFIFYYITNPALLAIEFFYLKVGIIVGIIPIILVLLRFPSQFDALLKTTVYFFYLAFLFEIVALTLGQWAFPAEAQFIGFINIASIRFPVEELLFWILLGGMAALSYYKFFDD